jgi:hypothetical protein
MFDVYTPLNVSPTISPSHASPEFEPRIPVETR